MKIKLNLSKDGMKQFFLFHVEKIVFLLILVVTVLLIYGGYGHKPIDSNQGPEELQTLATEANSYIINGETWAAIKADRFPQPDEYETRVDDALVKVDAADYPTDTLLVKPTTSLQVKRTDPALYSIERLIARAGVGAVAYNSPENNNTFVTDEQIGEPVNVRPTKAQNEFLNSGHNPKAGSDLQSKYFVALLGIVPVKKQLAEYLRVFAKSAGYDETRDKPEYGYVVSGEMKLTYVVERAEILDDGTLSEWAIVGHSLLMKSEGQKWTPPPEIVDDRYVKPDFTSGILPIVLRNLEPFAVHPDVPRKSKGMHGRSTPNRDGPLNNNFDNLDIDSFTSTQHQPDNKQDDQFQQNAEPEHFLFRYYDFNNLVPGKSYQYRVKLYLIDPNNPLEATKPAPWTLDPNVIARINQQRDQYWVITPPSEPSPAVRIPFGSRLYAGKFTPEKNTIYKGGKIRQSEPVADALAIAWDSQNALDVPAVKQVSRGTLVNFNKDAIALKPGSSEFIKLLNYDIKTDLVVLDLRGCSLDNRRSDLAAPGEMLVVDDRGRLTIHNELDDYDDFAKYDFVETRRIDPSDDEERRRNDGGNGDGLDGF